MPISENTTLTENNHGINQSKEILYAQLKLLFENSQATLRRLKISDETIAKWTNAKNKQEKVQAIFRALKGYSKKPLIIRFFWVLFGWKRKLELQRLWLITELVTPIFANEFSNSKQKKYFINKLAHQPILKLFPPTWQTLLKKFQQYFFPEGSTMPDHSINTQATVDRTGRYLLSIKYGAALLGRHPSINDKKAIKKASQSLKKKLQNEHLYLANVNNEKRQSDYLEISALKEFLEKFKKNQKLVLELEIANNLESDDLKKQIRSAVQQGLEYYQKFQKWQNDLNPQDFMDKAALHLSSAHSTISSLWKKGKEVVGFNKPQHRETSNLAPAATENSNELFIQVIAKFPFTLTEEEKEFLYYVTACGFLSIDWKTATQTDVNKAYRQTSLIFHPDKAPAVCLMPITATFYKEIWNDWFSLNNKLYQRITGFIAAHHSLDETRYQPRQEIIDRSDLIDALFNHGCNARQAGLSDVKYMEEKIAQGNNSAIQIRNERQAHLEADQRAQADRQAREADRQAREEADQRAQADRQAREEAEQRAAESERQIKELQQQLSELRSEQQPSDSRPSSSSPTLFGGPR